MNTKDRYVLAVLKNLLRGPRTFPALQKIWYPKTGYSPRHAANIARALHILTKHGLVDLKIPKGYTEADYTKASRAFNAALAHYAATGKEPKVSVAGPPPCAYCLTPVGRLIAKGLM